MRETVSHRARISYQRMTAAAIEAHGNERLSPWIYPALLFAALMLAVWVGHLIAFRLAQDLPSEWMFAIGPSLPTRRPNELSWRHW